MNGRAEDGSLFEELPCAFCTPPGLGEHANQQKKPKNNNNTGDEWLHQPLHVIQKPTIDTKQEARRLCDGALTDGAASLVALKASFSPEQSADKTLLSGNWGGKKKEMKRNDGRSVGNEKDAAIC